MNDSDARNIARIVEFYEDLEKEISEQGITAESIQSERFVQWAITTPLYNIGEFTSHISKEFRSQHPEIPWSKVSGMRHRLVHDYGGTDWSIICDIVFRDLPDYIAQLRLL